MSEWTDLSAKVFQHRYDVTSWSWSAKPEDTYTAGAVFEARLAMILYPGQQAAVEGKKGWFAINNNVGAPLNSGVKSPLVTAPISFRTVPSAFGYDNLNRQLQDNDFYVDAKKWYREDWTLNVLVQKGGMDWRYKDFLIRAMELWTKVLVDLDWVPETVIQQVYRATMAGYLPRMHHTSIWTSNWGPLPPWLESPYRQAAWNEMTALVNAINQEVSAANMARLNEQAKALQASRAFWDKIAELSGVDAIAGAWDKLQQTILGFNKTVNVGRKSLQETRALIAKNPELYSDEVKQKTQRLHDDLEKSVAGARSQIPSSVIQALSRDGQGIGIATAALITLGVTGIVAATTVLISWKKMAENTTRESLANQQEVVMAAESAANVAYAMEQDAILDREKELNALFDAGKISELDYERAIMELRERARINNSELANRRATTKQIADAHAQNQQELKQSTILQALQEAKGMILLGVLGLGVITLGPAVARKMSQK